MGGMKRTIGGLNGEQVALPVVGRQQIIPMGGMKRTIGGLNREQVVLLVVGRQEIIPIGGMNLNKTFLFA